MACMRRLLGLPSSGVRAKRRGKACSSVQGACQSSCFEAPTSCSLVMLSVVKHAAVWLVRRPQQREHQGRPRLGAAAAKAKGQVCLQRVLCKNCIASLSEGGTSWNLKKRNSCLRQARFAVAASAAGRPVSAPEQLLRARHSSNLTGALVRGAAAAKPCPGRCAMWQHTI